MKRLLLIAVFIAAISLGPTVGRVKVEITNGETTSTIIDEVNPQGVFVVLYGKDGKVEFPYIYAKFEKADEICIESTKTLFVQTMNESREFKPGVKVCLGEKYSPTFYSYSEGRS